MILAARFITGSAIVLLFSAGGIVSPLSANDFDGQWDATENCSASPSIRAWTKKFQIKVQNGNVSGQSRMKRRTTSIASYSGKLQSGALSVTAHVQIADKKGPRTIQYSGSATDDGKISLSGELTRGGRPLRDCTLILTNRAPSVVVETQPRPEKSTPSTTTQKQQKVDQKKSQDQQSAIEKIIRGMVLRIDPELPRLADWISRIPAVPIQQQQFCEIVSRFEPALQEAYGARNDIRKNRIYLDRKKDMAALLPKGSFHNWIVRIAEVTQAPDGSAAVMLQLPCLAMLGSDSCLREGARAYTIAVKSSAFRELEQADARKDFAVVSGRILYAEGDQSDVPLPVHALYEPGSHCSAVANGKKQDVFVTDVDYLVRLR